MPSGRVCDVDAATILKEQGNVLFKAGDVEGALRAYLEALVLEPNNYVLYR